MASVSTKYYRFMTPNQRVATMKAEMNGHELEPEGTTVAEVGAMWRCVKCGALGVIDDTEMAEDFKRRCEG